jgi:hypothetical protein
VAKSKQKTKRKNAASYGISRVDDPTHRTHAWRVSLRRRGKALVRNFPDIKWGGKRKALQAAREFRDRLLKKFPPLSRAEFAQSPRINNKSGVTGVCLVACKYRLVNGKERCLWYWEAIWPTAPGEHANKRFSVANHGSAKAFELACDARRLGLRKVRGAFWASERGAQETAAKAPARNSRAVRETA